MHATLNCELRHDNGTIEKLNAPCNIDDWATTFNWMVDAYCRENDRELFPINITFIGEVVCEYDSNVMDMVDTENWDD